MTIFRLRTVQKYFINAVLEYCKLSNGSDLTDGYKNELEKED